MGSRTFQLKVYFLKFNFDNFHYLCLDIRCIIFIFELPFILVKIKVMHINTQTILYHIIKIHMGMLLCMVSFSSFFMEDFIAFKALLIFCAFANNRIRMFMNKKERKSLHCVFANCPFMQKF